MKLPFARGALAAILLCAVATSSAQSYPAGPLRIVVPFPAGGGVDTAGRLLGQKLSEAIGKPVVIDNRAGANGMIGSEMVAKSPKDGYTLLVNGANFVTTPSLYKNVTYDPIKDFEPISLLAHAPNILVVHPSLPVKSVRELIAFAKARPGQLNYASSASGSTPHLAAELFNTLTGTRMVHVPYRGTGPAITAIISGEITVMFMPALAAIPYIENGRLRALGVTTTERLPAMPALPTVAEAGLKGYQSSQWYGVLAPAGTPADILDFLNGHAAKIMQSAEMKERMKNSGSVAVGSTRDAFARHLQSEFTKWAKIIKASGATVN
ncbi:MAG: tripartite tricarboxylate transporter substrate binding protein [Betaproteobacteria bacterium]|nr:tripartite tricarboxylate transporter substrate binding protein [Betaproteobacteria bacterium]